VRKNPCAAEHADKNVVPARKPPSLTIAANSDRLSALALAEPRRGLIKR
jgi:hypothetical protein